VNVKYAALSLTPPPNLSLWLQSGRAQEDTSAGVGPGLGLGESDHS
jgi:hypothetical protein